MIGMGNYNKKIIKQQKEELIKSRQALAESEMKYRALVEMCADAIFIETLEGRVLECNEAACRMYGYTMEEMIGLRIHDLVPEDFARTLPDIITPDLVSSGVYVERVSKKKDGTIFPTEINTRIIELNGEKRLIAYIHDITERKQKEEQLAYISYHDILTGLYNRAFFEEALKKLDNESNLPLSIIMGDVDGLKVTNDTHGHQQGDKLLVQIAEILANSCRRNDIVTRWGGDEFVIILPDTNYQETLKVCERIRSACVEAPRTLNGISISLGCATKAYPEQSTHDILSQACISMYEEKSNKKTLAW